MPRTAPMLTFLVLASCTSDAPPAAAAAPSASVLHRLTPNEVDNSLRDILGAPTRRAEQAGLPRDLGEFSTTSDLQADGPVLVAALLDAARQSVSDALAPRPSTFKTQPTDLGLDIGQIYQDPLGGDPDWVVHRESTSAVTLDRPWSGAFTATLRVSAFGVDLFLDDLDPPSPPTVRFTDPTTGVSSYTELPLTADLAWQDLTLTTSGPPGLWPLEISVWTDGWFAVAIEGLYLNGQPDDPAVLAPPAAPLLTCDDDGCLRRTLARIGRLAWRRTLDDAELDDLVAWATQPGPTGAPPDHATQVARGLTALFSDPRFLFRVEPSDGRPRRALTAEELAGRLAAFLWSSAPDDTLMSCASAGALLGPPGPCALATQVDRMLADPRADALLLGFAQEWLGIDSLDQLARDPTQWPEWGPDLAASMRAETRALLDRSLRDDVPVRDLLTWPSTWVDDALAALYGADPAPDGTWTPPAGAATGLLRHASILTATSQPQRTSIVNRGVFILDRLLCDPPEGPPPGVPPLPEGEGTGTLDLHLEPACASCHAEIDPLGVPLEGFDAIGVARQAWPDGTPVVTSATTADGAPLDGPVALATWLAGRDEVPACAQRKLYTWAVQRELGPEDDAVLASIDPGPDASLGDQVRAIATSEAFRTWVEAP